MSDDLLPLLLLFLAHTFFLLVDDLFFPLCPQEKEMEKQKLLYQQARLHSRGAAEMVLQTISTGKSRKMFNIYHHVVSRPYSVNVLPVVMKLKSHQGP